MNIFGKRRGTTETAPAAKIVEGVSSHREEVVKAFRRASRTLKSPDEFAVASVHFRVSGIKGRCYLSVIGIMPNSTVQYSLMVGSERKGEVVEGLKEELAKTYEAVLLEPNMSCYYFDL